MLLAPAESINNCTCGRRCLGEGVSPFPCHFTGRGVWTHPYIECGLHRAIGATGFHLLSTDTFLEGRWPWVYAFFWLIDDFGLKSSKLKPSSLDILFLSFFWSDSRQTIYSHLVLERVGSNTVPRQTLRNHWPPRPFSGDPLGAALGPTRPRWTSPPTSTRSTRCASLSAVWSTGRTSPAGQGRGGTGDGGRGRSFKRPVSSHAPGHCPLPK